MTILVTNNDIIDYTSFVSDPQIAIGSDFNDIDYTPYAVKVDKGDTIIQDITTTTEGWVKWHNFVSGGATHTSLFEGVLLFQLTDADSDNFLKAVQDTTSSASLKPWHFEYWDGAAWVILTGELAKEEKHYIDINFKIDASAGFFVIYLDGQEIGRFEGKTNHNGSNISRLIFTGDMLASGSSPFVAISQLIVSDSESTIDMRLATLEVDGEGATSGWTGLFTDINEQDIDVNTKITSGLANDISTYTITGLSANILASPFLNILSVNVHHYIRDNLGSPGDVQQAVRISSIDFFGPTDSSIGAGYALSINRFVNNPDTTNPWVLTDIATLEIGAKSI